MQIQKGDGSCKAHHNNYQTYSLEGGIKTRAHVEVQVTMTQNARGNRLFLASGHTFDPLNPRQSVKRDCKGQLSRRGLGRLNSLCRIPIIFR